MARQRDAEQADSVRLEKLAKEMDTAFPAGAHLGSLHALAAAVRSGRGFRIAAIGSSNVVRGGCHEWQRTKCSHPRYRSGWLVRAFRLLNATFPHANNSLVNNARMATGPDYFSSCVNSAVPLDTDLVVIGFAEMCDVRSVLAQPESAFSRTVERIVRTLMTYPRPPSVLLWNWHKWTQPGCTRRPCAFWESCDSVLTIVAQYYFLPMVSMRNAMYTAATQNASRLSYQLWTVDGGGHLDLKWGDQLAAVLLTNYLRRALRSPLLTDIVPPVALPPPLFAPISTQVRARGGAAVARSA